jgi:predicted O-linked N-acetylglucosamine transferase (SPINDLY family)
VKEYVRLAVEGTADKMAMIPLRKLIRERFRNSPVLDGKAVVKEIEDWYRQAWSRWLIDKVDQQGARAWL